MRKKKAKRSCQEIWVKESDKAERERTCSPQAVVLIGAEHDVLPQTRRRILKVGAVEGALVAGLEKEGCIARELAVVRQSWRDLVDEIRPANVPPRHQQPISREGTRRMRNHAPQLDCVPRSPHRYRPVRRPRNRLEEEVNLLLDGLRVLQLELHPAIRQRREHPRDPQARRISCRPSRNLHELDGVSWAEGPPAGNDFVRRNRDGGDVGGEDGGEVDRGEDGEGRKIVFEKGDGLCAGDPAVSEDALFGGARNVDQLS